MDVILHWLSDNYGWLLSLLIQSFIAYHIFFRTKRLLNKDRLEHKEKIKQKAEYLIGIRRNAEVYLVNINRYFRDYPSNDEKRFESYSHIRAEI